MTPDFPTILHLKHFLSKTAVAQVHTKLHTHLVDTAFDVNFGFYNDGVMLHISSKEDLRPFISSYPGEPFSVTKDGKVVSLLFKSLQKMNNFINIIIAKIDDSINKL